MQNRRGASRLRSHFHVLFLTAAPLVALGCATALVPGLPKEEAPLKITGEALDQTDHLYLWPDRLDKRVLVGALDALEQRFDRVRFDVDDDGKAGVLEVNGARVRVPLQEKFDPAEYREILARALAFTKEHLDEEIDPDDDLEHIALRGALGALDRYTTVFSGRGSEDFKIRFEGRLSGIGARLSRRDGDLIAVRVFPGSPAAKSGLKDGDAILTIDGDPTRPLSVEEAVDRIRGRADTVVALGVERGDPNASAKDKAGDDKKQRLDVTITRGEVQIPSVESRKVPGVGKVGYAQVYQVSRDTASEFKDRVAELGPLDGLVIDMRENTGGSMIAAAQLADLFLDSQLIVKTVMRPDLPQPPNSSIYATRPVLYHYPIVILVDPMTASAAEIISGALQARGNVTLMGQKTFGKGLVQQVMPLPDDNLLKLTIAEYLLSGDRAINEKGIPPDVPLYPVSKASLAPLADVPAGAIPYLRGTGEDDTFPLDAAATFLREPHDQALVDVRKKAYAGIVPDLLKLGVAYSSQRGATDAALPKPLVIQAESASLRSGETGKVQLSITNPNDFDIPDAWLALSAPADYLDNQLAGLGVLKAGETRHGEFELTPPDGISVAHHPVDVLAASGDRPLGKQRIVIEVASKPADLEIEVQRISVDSARVKLTNKSAHKATQLTVAVPGATRSLDELAPGASQDLDLPLPAQPKTIAIAQLGPWAQRRVDVPIPAEHATYTLPEVVLDERTADIALHARAGNGLRDGWIALDGQKKALTSFDGKNEGEIDVPVASGEHDLVAKIETSDGVAIFDLRHLTREGVTTSSK
ncbi:MAG TPA: S41 family peptidase [Myxococcota bacterium]|nr:S41 family peptidase [Myxococcota bacterium]